MHFGACAFFIGYAEHVVARGAVFLPLVAVTGRKAVRSCSTLYSQVMFPSARTVYPWTITHAIASTHTQQHERKLGAHAPIMPI